MSQEDRELALEAYAAAIARPPDFETINRLFHPDHVFVPLTAQVDTREFRGASGFREFTDLSDWKGAIEGAVDFGRGRVVLVTQGQYRGSASGATLPLRTWIVVTLRGGKVLRTELYADPAKALEAAGLSEQAMSQENVEIVRRVFEAVARRDTASVLALYDPDVEVHFSQAHLLIAWVRQAPTVAMRDSAPLIES